jgi:hypothetical protein
MIVRPRIVWPGIVWRSLTALAVLFVTLSVSLVATSDAQAGGHGKYAGHAKAVRMVKVQAVRSHPAIAYASRPYTAASYAPRAHHGYAHHGYAGHGAARVVHYAAPVRQIRYVHYQPTVYHQAAYSTVRRACTPRPHCVC